MSFPDEHDWHESAPISRAVVAVTCIVLCAIIIGARKIGELAGWWQ